jgi:hypothetical protein
MVDVSLRHFLLTVKKIRELELDAVSEWCPVISSLSAVVCAGPRWGATGGLGGIVCLCVEWHGGEGRHLPSMEDGGVVLLEREAV